jgi:hypothetical protein
MCGVFLDGNDRRYAGNAVVHSPFPTGVERVEFGDCVDRVVFV